ncbi:MAG: methyltransferase domain-containing protein [Gammaproteobacteria bacterium]|nr:methyltransferase domain-containing protein [Gammaproteobacteria bacterium]
MPSDHHLSESQQLNVKKWQIAARGFRELGEENWRRQAPAWGLWSRSDEALNLLPDDLKGKRCLDIGCGTGYILKWMADRGAMAIGLEPTDNQLVTAVGLSQLHDTDVSLIQGFGEELPFADDSFDFAISEYGAALWADPYQWIPEAARVLKPDCQLVIYTDHMLSLITDNGLDEPDGAWTETLQRSYFDVYRLKWSADGSDGVEYHLAPGEWIALFRQCGFSVEALHELPAPQGATSRFSYASADWGSKWPAEQVWKVRKVA